MSIVRSNRYEGELMGDGDCEDASGLLMDWLEAEGSSSVGLSVGNVAACVRKGGSTSISRSSSGCGKLFARRAAAAACSR